MHVPGSNSSKLIGSLYSDIKRGVLKLQPSFQRKLVWNEGHNEAFIETILLKMPFPEIYTAIGERNIETKEATTLVVDGQQRLNAIFNYIEGSEDAFRYRTIKRFSELSDDESNDFLNYPVVVRELGSLTLDKIKEIFKRINSVNYALNAVEINNALFDGEYITAAIEIKNQMSLYKIFNDAEYSRMKDLEFVLALMVTYDLGGYFTQFAEIDKYVELYNNEYPKKDSTISAFSEISKLIESLRLPYDSLWKTSRNAFFSAFVELLWLYNRINVSEKTDIIKGVLIDIENTVLEVKKKGLKDKGEYTDFYNALYQQTSSKKNRQLRGDIIRKKLYTALEIDVK